MATHSSVLAWRLAGTGEHGGLPSTGSHKVGHDSRDLAAAAAASSQKSCSEYKYNEVPHPLCLDSLFTFCLY